MSLSLPPSNLHRKRATVPVAPGIPTVKYHPKFRRRKRQAAPSASFSGWANTYANFLLRSKSVLSDDSFRTRFRLGAGDGESSRLRSLPLAGGVSPRVSSSIREECGREDDEELRVEAVSSPRWERVTDSVCLGDSYPLRGLMYGKLWRALSGGVEGVGLRGLRDGTWRGLRDRWGEGVDLRACVLRGLRIGKLWRALNGGGVEGRGEGFDITYPLYTRMAKRCSPKQFKRSTKTGLHKGKNPTLVPQLLPRNGFKQFRCAGRRKRQAVVGGLSAADVDVKRTSERRERKHTVYNSAAGSPSQVLVRLRIPGLGLLFFHVDPPDAHKSSCVSISSYVSITKFRAPPYVKMDVMPTLKSHTLYTSLLRKSGFNAMEFSLVKRRYNSRMKYECATIKNDGYFDSLLPQPTKPVLDYCSHNVQPARLRLGEMLSVPNTATVARIWHPFRVHRPQREVVPPNNRFAHAHRLVVIAPSDNILSLPHLQIHPIELLVVWDIRGVVENFVIRAQASAASRGALAARRQLRREVVMETAQTRTDSKTATRKVNGTISPSARRRDCKASRKRTLPGQESENATQSQRWDENQMVWTAAEVGSQTSHPTHKVKEKRRRIRGEFGR
ncbi:hypothetical protein C8R47DRAFT_1082963 [Mycena vitilis]|nr:hypothetical protein C8R47DRAFT_1082963 [Mycena vitilis]